MAEAPGHRLGQIIGDTLERAIEPVLATFAEDHALYLDSCGIRAARTGKKVTWKDALGNKHDLDFVLERGGTDDHVGIPVAFIESAWRRYTKHSRAKAQEIQAAVLPLAAKYAHTHPFVGVVLAGLFTGGSLNQLRSNGFSVLYVAYDTIVEVFKRFGIDTALDEGTSDRYMQSQVDRYDQLDQGGRDSLGSALREAMSSELGAFMADLSTAVLRKVVSVSIIPLHGHTLHCSTVKEAITLLSDYETPSETAPLVRFEVIMRYDNGDRIVADFQSASDAVDFLETLTR